MGSRINIYSVQLVKESAKVYDVDRRIKSPDDAHAVIERVMGLSSKTKEHLVMMSLNTKNDVIGIHTIHIGTVNSSIVHPREILQQAILNNATSFMIFHNHPSGDPTPSPQDIAVTRQIARAGELLNVFLVDHIIIGDHTYISLKERGYIK